MKQSSKSKSLEKSSAKKSKITKETISPGQNKVSSKLKPASTKSSARKVKKTITSEKKSERLRVLIVEDSEDDAKLMARKLKRGGYDLEFKRVETPEDFSSEIENGGWDIIISDYTMPRFSGLEALDILKKSGIDLPFILISGTIGEDLAVEAMIAGAHDYIMKGRWARLIPAIKRELQEVTVRKEGKQAEEALLLRTHDLGERVKELNCLYSISKITNRDYISSKGIFQAVVNTIPPGWQYPEITCARIKMENQIYATDNFQETKWRLASDIIVQGKKAGYVEVCYLKEMPEMAEGPFLSEERLLIDEIATRIVLFIERRKAEKYLTRLGRILDKSSGEIYIFDSDTLNLKMVNVTARHNLGLAEEELMRLRIFDLNTDHNEWEFKYFLKRIFDGDADNIIVQTFHRRADGSEYPVELNISILSKEAPPVYVAVAQDITERNRADKKLRESEQMFRSITQTALVAIITADSAGTIVSWNKGAEKLFGYSEKEIINEPSTVLIPERFREKHNDGLERVRVTGKSTLAEKPIEFSGLKKNGNEFPLVMTISTWETEEGRFFSAIITEKHHKN